MISILYTQSQVFNSVCNIIMKTTLILISSLAFVLGGVPKDRFDPCIFIDCTKEVTSNSIQSTTKATVTKTITPSPANTQKSEDDLLKNKDNELASIASNMVKFFNLDIFFWF